MNFHDSLFFYFLGASFILFQLIKGSKFRNLFLLFISYIFYASWESWFLIILILTTVIDYSCGRKIHSEQSNGRSGKPFFFLSLGLNLGLLIGFRYIIPALVASFPFLLKIGDIGNLLNNNLIPLGISYYTFQTLSYTIDIYRGKIKPEKNYIDYSLFVAFFPQLLGGPIERARTFLPQIKSNVLHPDYFKALWLISYGYFLKFFVFDHLILYSNLFLDNYKNSVGAPGFLIYFVMSLILIFTDFAGYSKIARGIGYLFGFSLMKNFGTPLFVTSYHGFWKEWHISLTTWLSDYLYQPLRKRKMNSYLAFSIVFFVIGMWHGITWKYLWVSFFFGGTYCLNVFLYKKKWLFSSKSQGGNLVVGYFLACVLSYWFMVPTASHALELFLEIMYFGKIDWELIFTGMKYFTLFSTPVFLIEYISFKHSNEFAILNKKVTPYLIGGLIFITLLFRVDDSNLFIYFLF